MRGPGVILRSGRETLHPMSDFYRGVLGDAAPEIHPDAWVAPGAVVIGKVRLGRGASVWYGCVLRGDDDEIVVGDEVNIQDLSCIHADPGLPTVLEPRVSLGHKATVHGAVIEEGALIGIGAIVLNGARVGAGSLVAAGAVVTPGTEVPPRSVVAGVPGKVRREVTNEDAAMVARTPSQYVAKAKLHRTVRWH